MGLNRRTREAMAIKTGILARVECWIVAQRENGGIRVLGSIASSVEEADNIVKAIVPFDKIELARNRLYVHIVVLEDKDIAPLPPQHRIAAARLLGKEKQFRTRCLVFRNMHNSWTLGDRFWSHDNEDFVSSQEWTSADAADTP